LVSGSAPSGYGKTSPEPDPTWDVVSKQLALRLPNFSGKQLLTTSEENNDDNSNNNIIQTESIEVSVLEANEFLKNKKREDNIIVVALGVSTEEEERRFLAALDYYQEKKNDSSSPIKAILADPTCSSAVLERRAAGSYGGGSIVQDATAQLAPWSDAASMKRLLEKTDTLLGRKSSEDYIFAVLFCINALVRELDVVKSDINPSWEKGIVRNVQEFKKMTDCCGPQIAAALSDPTTKNAIDLLNAVDLRDQVGSYRVIVSNETPELEEFTLCILQQNDCFNCDAPILDRPRVPLLQQWGGKGPLDDESARQILMGHLNHPMSHPQHSQKLPWSWKIVVGANPAYDAFPMQHQIFYPSGSSGKSLWYDPVFCVETLSEELVWCKRHYRCSPRKHWSSSSSTPTPGAWTFTTLDNGMMSEERWTTVDAADDLSWAVLHYSGAAKRAGQSYVGALLCTPDGLWPTASKEEDRIREAFRKCDLQLWELFGGSRTQSFMWSDEFLNWAEQHPPPLERIGDISINAWRKQEREKAMKTKDK